MSKKKRGTKTRNKISLDHSGPLAAQVIPFMVNIHPTDRDSWNARQDGLHRRVVRRPRAKKPGRKAKASTSEEHQKHSGSGRYRPCYIPEQLATSQRIPRKPKQRRSL